MTQVQGKGITFPSRNLYYYGRSPVKKKQWQLKQETKKLQLSLVNYLDYRFARCCCTCPAFQVDRCGKTKFPRPFCWTFSKNICTSYQVSLWNIVLDMEWNKLHLLHWRPLCHWNPNWHLGNKLSWNVFDLKFELCKKQWEHQLDERGKKSVSGLLEIVADQITLKT